MSAELRSGVGRTLGLVVATGVAFALVAAATDLLGAYPGLPSRFADASIVARIFATTALEAMIAYAVLCGVVLLPAVLLRDADATPISAPASHLFRRAETMS